jgi:hypothetical protein
MFSAVLRKIDRTGALAELSYDGVIRVLPGSIPDPTRTTDYIALQGITTFTCTDPKCVSGTPPLRSGVQCSVAVQKPAGVEAESGGATYLYVGANGSRTQIPIFNVSDDTTLWAALKAYRKNARLEESSAFHVYKIMNPPPELRQLQDKWIALPIPCKDCGAAECGDGKPAST